VDGKPISLSIIDTSGSKDNSKLQERILPYLGLDVVLLCFAVDNFESFQDIRNFWIPEIKTYCPEASLEIVGTKIDLLANATNPVSSTQATNLANEFLTNYHPISALTQEGLHHLFLDSLRKVIKSPPPK
jgi:GTPase SAR1 family protein